MNIEYDKQTRVWMCERKFRHTTIREAEAHIDMLVLSGTPRRTLTYYPCPICSGFHVTSGRQKHHSSKHKARKKRRS